MFNLMTRRFWLASIAALFGVKLEAAPAAPQPISPPALKYCRALVLDYNSSGCIADKFGFRHRRVVVTTEPGMYALEQVENAAMLDRVPLGQKVDPEHRKQLLEAFDTHFIYPKAFTANMAEVQSDGSLSVLYYEIGNRPLVSEWTYQTKDEMLSLEPFARNLPVLEMLTKVYPAGSWRIAQLSASGDLERVLSADDFLITNRQTVRGPLCSFCGGVIAKMTEVGVPYCGCHLRFWRDHVNLKCVSIVECPCGAPMPPLKACTICQGVLHEPSSRSSSSGMCWHNTNKWCECYHKEWQEHLANHGASA